MTWLERAVEEFDNSSFKDGDLISKEWLLFALEVPSSGSRVEDLMFLFLNRFEAFRDYLLIQRKVALENVRGRGYRIVPPSEQARFAAEEALKLIKKGLNKGSRIVSNTRTHLLSNEEAAFHVDTQVKLLGLQQMVSRRRKDLLGR